MVDQYANRIRFLSEVAQAISEVWTPSRIGVRLSPRGTFNDMSNRSPESTAAEIRGV